jgi:hypothetical protein
MKKPKLFNHLTSQFHPECFLNPWDSKTVGFYSFKYSILPKEIKQRLRKLVFWIGNKRKVLLCQTHSFRKERRSFKELPPNDWDLSTFSARLQIHNSSNTLDRLRELRRSSLFLCPFLPFRIKKQGRPPTNQSNLIQRVNNRTSLKETPKSQ